VPLQVQINQVHEQARFFSPVGTGDWYTYSIDQVGAESEVQLSPGPMDRGVGGGPM